MAGIYLHIPFCKSRCVYCDFYSSTALGRREALVAALREELTARKDFLGNEPLKTVYFGGGTPSLCSPAQIASLMDTIRELWDTSALEEVTLEANPDDLDEAYLAGLHETGINRLSLGIQSFSEKTLRWMNRRHTAAGAIQAVEEARKAGFDNISIDLIYGLPGEPWKAWEESLQQAIDLEVEHISAYHLTIEPGTELGRRAASGALDPVSEEAGLEQFLLLHRRLVGAGMEHYEISNFARPGRRSRHNGSYWTGSPYLGAGPSAHSYDGHRLRRWNAPDLESYLAAGPSGGAFEQEELLERDLYNEYLMTRLRTAEGVDAGEIGARFGRDVSDYFTGRAARFVTGGLLKQDRSRYSIPPERFFTADGVISDLFDVGPGL